MANLKALADHLGLSQATVSRALNGYDTVNADTRKRVEAAARQLNYRPNTSARRLATGRANAVGIVMPSEDGRLVDPHFADFLAGLTRTLATRDIDIVMTASPLDTSIATYRRFASTGKVDGFVISFPKRDDPRIEDLLDLAFPFVVHGQCGATRPYSYYDIDNQGAFARATELLCQLGHTRIGIFNGEPDAMFTVQRRQGIRAALTEAGHIQDPALTVEAPMTEEVGYREMERMLALPTPPTAILCSSMLLALGAQRAIREAGLIIGHDVSVISHDDGLSSLKTENFSVPLTVTRAPIRQAGSRIADMLTDLIDGRGVQTHVAPVDLIVRGSTAPPPSGR
ncbi:MAG: substrate-binding domain-containing protein [Pseudomonadota bacterium]